MIVWGVILLVYHFGYSMDTGIDSFRIPDLRFLSEEQCQTHIQSVQPSINELTTDRKADIEKMVLKCVPLQKK